MTTATKTALTAKEARELLLRAVNQRGPAYVYERNPANAHACVYFNAHGQPSCLIGQMISYLGIGPFDFGSKRNRSTTATELVRSLFPDTEPLVLNALRQAQYVQDTGKTWGEALAAYDARLAAG